MGMALQRGKLTQGGEFDKLNDRAVFGDVKKSDFTFVFPFIWRHNVFDVKFGVGSIVVDHQLTSERKKKWRGRVGSNHGLGQIKFSSFLFAQLNNKKWLWVKV